MSLNEGLVFTLLPNGVTTKNNITSFRFSVFVSPRLTPNPSPGTLAQFAPDLSNANHGWPTTLENSTFAVVFNGSTTLGATLVTAPLDLNTALWNTLFPSTTSVNPYQIDTYNNFTILSYPTKNLHAFIQNQYLLVAASSPKTFPSLSTLGQNGLGQIGIYRPPSPPNFWLGDDSLNLPAIPFPNFTPNITQQDMDNTINNLLLLDYYELGGRQAIDYTSNAYKTAMIKGTNYAQTINGLIVQPQLDFEQVRRFYKNLASSVVPGTPPSGSNMRDPSNSSIITPFVPDSTTTNPSHGDLVAPTLDFHKEVSSLSQYTGTTDSPGLLRMLGLIFDLEVTMPEFSLPSTGTVSLSVTLPVILSSSTAPRSLMTPQTAYLLDTSQNPILFTTGGNASPPVPSDLTGPDTSRSMLNLGGNNFTEFQIDLDAGAIKVSHFADAILRLLFGVYLKNYHKIDASVPANLGISEISVAGKGLPQSMISPDTPQSYSLPSLKSGGISLARVSRGFELAAIINHAQTNNSTLGSTAILYAEDVTRGYRVDVWTVGGTDWKSLCRRDGTYKIGTPPNGTPISPPIPSDEEGWVSLGATQQAADPSISPPPSITTLNLHESTIRWRGWSLLAPRPAAFRRISQDNSVTDPNTGLPVGAETVDTYDPDQAAADANTSGGNNIPLSVTYAVHPNTLPALRFGSAYQMRARAVDMAGNSLALNDATIKDPSKPWVTKSITYTRFEPVQPPSIILRTYLNPAATPSPLPSPPPPYLVGITTNNPLYDPTGYPFPAPNPPTAPLRTTTTEISTIPPEPSMNGASSQDSPGEQLDRLVIRSNFNTPATTYNANLNSLFAGKNFLAISERNIAPPRSTESMAELLGALDDPITHKLFGNTNTSYADIVSRDLWAFDQYQTFLGNTGTPAKAQYLTLPAQLLITNFDNRDVHYIADPMALGASLSFFDVDGNPLNGGNALLVPFYPTSTSWPKLKLFKLKLEEGTTSPYKVESAPSQAGGDLVLSLPKGTWVDIQLSSYLSSTDATPQRMGLLSWAAQFLTPAQLNTLETLTKSGQCWMITPYRKLRLLHASQQPVNAPDFFLSGSKFIIGFGIGENRGVGWTYANLFGTVHYHGSSTAKLDVLAGWEEPVDDPGADPYNPQPVQDGKPWGTGIPTSTTSAGGVHHLHHIFQLSQLDPGWGALSFFDGNSLPSAFPAPQSQKHEFGDTKRRLIRYTVAATTRFLEYLSDQVWKDPSASPPYSQPIMDQNNLPQNIVRYSPQGGSMDQPDNTKWTKWFLDIPSSARPAKPLVAYVVPTFTWVRNAKSLTSTRVGGFRVYMNRPWYSSGFGELLGVVLWQGTGQLPPDNLKHLVTQWGQDPLWTMPGTTGLGTTTVSQQPVVSSFFGTSSAAKPTTAILEEVYQDVTVVPYDVGFDSGRNLWYADIEIASLSYFPFIRLALARYQPNSVIVPATKFTFGVNVSISPVVLADYMQITPYRGLIVKQNSPTQLEVELYGTFPTKSQAFTPGNVVQVTLQSRQPGVPDPDLGWTTVPSKGNQPNPVWLTLGTIAGIQVYAGPITLPIPRGTAGTTFRLLIAEYEQYLTDSTYTGPGPDPIIQPLPGLRLVYAETVLL